MKPLLLIKTGDTLDRIIPVHGNFEDWFTRGLACGTLLTVNVHRGQLLPDPNQVSGAVITGSVAMVSDREGWSEETGRWLVEAIERSLPILGVCYGHQLLAHALGGAVGPNPRGREIGTHIMTMESGFQADSLFGEHPDSFAAQTSHLETVLEMPASAVRLGHSTLDENAILRFSDTAWGVQYHPEFSAPVMREYITCRSSALIEEGLDVGTMKEQVAETPQAASVLPAFARETRGEKAA